VRRVLGAQFAVWTEYMPTPQHVEYMAFPRACAFAEVVWSAERQPYEAFLPRLRKHLDRLSALGVAYRRLD
jgi:hexosaminidase